MNRPRHHLPQVQKWMQSVIMHPDGIEDGVDSEETKQHIRVGTAEIEEVVRSTEKLSAMERLEIYGHAYHARLLECIRAEYPTMVHAIGEEAFDSFAFGYLQEYPSRSYTLNDLSRDFPNFLAETRNEWTEEEEEESESETADWPGFLVDLAVLERALGDVFDGPGTEGKELLNDAQLAPISPETWLDSRLVPAVCLKLIEFSFPVNAYLQSVRNDEDPEIPAPAKTYVAITRRNYTVYRYDITEVQHVLLSSLVNDETVGTALNIAAQTAGDMDIDDLAAELKDWFTTWTAAGFFERAETPD